MSSGTELSEKSARSRALAAALEPVVGSVYFAPEAHEAYAALGFGPGPGPIEGDAWAESHWGRVQLPDGVAYFASRGGVLGQVRGEVVAAAFGVFNPVVVVAAIDRAWAIADADAVVAARTRGAVAQLVRILGPEPDGIDRVTDLLALRRRTARHHRPADVRRPVGAADADRRRRADVAARRHAARVPR